MTLSFLTIREKVKQWASILAFRPVTNKFYVILELNWYKGLA